MKKLLFTICALLAVGSTFATNTFSINTVYASTSGISTIEVNYSLDAGFACGGFSFDLQLPDEFEFVGKTNYTPGDCYASAPTFTTNLTAEGVLKVAYATSDPLIKQSGTLASFQIRAKSSAEAGETYHGGLLTAAKFVDNSTSASENADDVSFDVVATNEIVLDEASTILPVAQSGVNVLVKRTLKKDVWNTVCFPYAMSFAKAQAAFGSDVEIADFTGFTKEGDKFTLSFTAHTSGALKVGTPYIIKPKADKSEFSVPTVTINPTINNVQIDDDETGEAAVIFKGTLKAGTVIPKDNVFISGNKFYYSTGSTAIKGFRGYFWIDGFTSSSPAPNFVVDGETTNIEGLQIVNGDGRIYNLNGQHVENPTKKGVYIQNGKKVVIKK